MTGLSSGEFTLWNALTFHFEMIMTAHDDPIRTVAWSPYDDWVISGDNSGRIMYWLPNLNNVKRFNGHGDPIRGLSYAPRHLCARLRSADRMARALGLLRRPPSLPAAPTTICSRCGILPRRPRRGRSKVIFSSSLSSRLAD